MVIRGVLETEEEEEHADVVVQHFSTSPPLGQGHRPPSALIKAAPLTCAQAAAQRPAPLSDRLPAPNLARL